MGGLTRAGKASDPGADRVTPDPSGPLAAPAPGPAGQLAAPHPSPGRFLAGDPLRGLAALAIAVYHAGTVSLSTSGHLGDLAHGWPAPFGEFVGGVLGACGNAVGVFFVLSGYLISRPFLAAFAEARRMPAVVDYLRNRALRIVPAYWVALGVVLLLAGAQGRGWADAPRLLGFSENWASSPIRLYLGQAWTLDVEIRYYLAVPVIAALLLLMTRMAGGHPRSRSVRLGLVGVAATLGGAVCFAVIARRTQQEAWTSGAQAHLLLLGVALAAAELGSTWQWLATRPGSVLGGGAFLGAVGALIWMQYPGTPLLDLPGLDFQRSTGVVATLGALVLVGGPVLRQRAGAGCWRALNNAPLRWLGARSYGFYLYQLGVLTELSRHAPAPGLYRRTFVFLVVVGLPVILLLAGLSWRWVEKPALRLRASRPRPDPSPLAAA